MPTSESSIEDAPLGPYLGDVVPIFFDGPLRSSSVDERDSLEPDRRVCLGAVPLVPAETPVVGAQDPTPAVLFRATCPVPQPTVVEGHGPDRGLRAVRVTEATYRGVECLHPAPRVGCELSQS